MEWRSLAQVQKRRQRRSAARISRRIWYIASMCNPSSLQPFDKNNTAKVVRSRRETISLSAPRLYLLRGDWRSRSFTLKSACPVRMRRKKKNGEQSHFFWFFFLFSLFKVASTRDSSGLLARLGTKSCNLLWKLGVWKGTEMHEHK